MSYIKKIQEHTHKKSSTPIKQLDTNSHFAVALQNPDTRKKLSKASPLTPLGEAFGKLEQD